MARQDSEWKSNGRPTSILALNFSAALDDIFKLSSSSSSELAMNVEQKRKEVRSHEENLQALNDRLRQATEQLKRLESKHHQHQRMQSESVSLSSSNTVPAYRTRRSGNHNLKQQQLNTNSYSDSEGTAYTDTDRLSATSDMDVGYQRQ